jgi:hypothetical protein
MAHLTLRRLQELGVVGCERMIERFACSVRGLPPSGAVLLTMLLPLR